MVGEVNPLIINDITDDTKVPVIFKDPFPKLAHDPMKVKLWHVREEMTKLDAMFKTKNPMLEDVPVNATVRLVGLANIRGVKVPVKEEN